MKKQSLAIFLTFVLVATNVLGSHVQAKGKTWYQKRIDFDSGTKKNLNKNFSLDLTGDGLPETVRFNEEKNDIVYYVNGQKASSNVDRGGYDPFSIYYVNVGNGRIYLVNEAVDGGYCSYDFYYYDTTSQTMKLALRTNQVYAKAGEVWSIQSVTETKIKTEIHLMPTEIGNIVLYPEFVSNGMNYKLASHYCKAETEEHYKLKACRKLKFYKSVHSKKVAYTSKKGMNLPLKKAYFTKKELWGGFAHGKKIGWRKLSYKNFDKFYGKKGNAWFYSKGVIRGF